MAATSTPVVWAALRLLGGVASAWAMIAVTSLVLAGVARRPTSHVQRDVLGRGRRHRGLHTGHRRVRRRLRSASADVAGPRRRRGCWRTRRRPPARSGGRVATSSAPLGASVHRCRRTCACSSSPTPAPASGTSSRRRTSCSSSATPTSARALEFVTWCVVGAFAACSPSLWNRVAGRRGERPALVAAHGVLAAGVMTTAFVPGTLGVLAGGALFGATFVGIVGVGVDLARRLHDLDPTRAIAVMTVAFAVGQMIGPAVGGWLADATGTFRVPSVVAAVVLIAGGAILLLPSRGGAAPIRLPSCRRCSTRWGSRPSSRRRPRRRERSGRRCCGRARSRSPSAVTSTPPACRRASTVPR